MTGLCGTCRAWSPKLPIGECTAIPDEDWLVKLPIDERLGARLLTQPDFGCVLWEAK